MLIRTFDDLVSMMDVQVFEETGSHEGLIRQTYYDSVGVPTWCVGMTNATGHHVERYWGNPQTLQHCMNLYVWAMRNYAYAVFEVVKGMDIEKHELAALLSFHWHTGAVKRAQWVKDWKAGNIAAARKNIMNWKSPPEIIPRRKKERALFFDGVWVGDGTMTEYTRLTAKKTPVWSSAVKVNVHDELTNALGFGKGGVVMDGAPAPDAPVNTKRPDPNASIGELLAAFLTALFTFLGRKEA